MLFFLFLVDMAIKVLEASLRGFGGVKLWRKKIRYQNSLFVTLNNFFCLEGPAIVYIAAFAPSNELFSYKVLNS